MGGTSSSAGTFGLQLSDVPGKVNCSTVVVFCDAPSKSLGCVFAQARPAVVGQPGGGWHSGGWVKVRRCLGGGHRCGSGCVGARARCSVHCSDHTRETYRTAAPFFLAFFSTRFTKRPSQSYLALACVPCMPANPSPPHRTTGHPSPVGTVRLSLLNLQRYGPSFACLFALLASLRLPAFSMRACLAACRSRRSSHQVKSIHGKSTTPKTGSRKPSQHAASPPPLPKTQPFDGFSQWMFLLPPRRLPVLVLVCRCRPLPLCLLSRTPPFTLLHRSTLMP